MFFYAKQVDPEFQESPVAYSPIEELFPEFYLTGNRSYHGYLPGWLVNISRTLSDASYELEHLEEGTSCYHSFAELVQGELPCKSTEEPYTEAELDLWKELVRSYNGDHLLRDMATVAYLVMGKPYEVCTIRGVCQGDWQNVLYPSAEEERLKYLADVYFNLGSEWRVFEVEEPVADLCELDEVDCDYCYIPDYEDTRTYLAEATDTSPDAIKLFAFDGYTKTPKYKEL